MSIKPYIINSLNMHSTYNPINKQVFLPNYSILHIRGLDALLIV